MSGSASDVGLLSGQRGCLSWEGSLTAPQKGKTWFGRGARGTQDGGGHSWRPGAGGSGDKGKSMWGAGKLEPGASFEAHESPL